jgi:hypothetical protein
MPTTPTKMVATSTMAVVTNEKEKKKKLIFAPRLQRGRSMTSRNCTNAACNIYKEERDMKKKKKKEKNHYDDEKYHVVYVDGDDEKSSVDTGMFFALFLFCSFLLLVITVSINLFLEDNNNNNIEGMSRPLASSSFFHPSSLLPRKDSRDDNNNRCAKTPDAVPVPSKSSDINQLFEKIVAVGTNYTHRNETIFTHDYYVTVHSRPDDIRNGSQNRRRGVVSSSSPWMVTLENFLTDHECDSMIDNGLKKEGFHPSIDTKEQNHHRTSTPNTTTTTMKTVG